MSILHQFTVLLTVDIRDENACFNLCVGITTTCIWYKVPIGRYTCAERPHVGVNKAYINGLGSSFWLWYRQDLPPLIRWNLQQQSNFKQLYDVLMIAVKATSREETYSVYMDWYVSRQTIWRGREFILLHTGPYSIWKWSIPFQETLRIYLGNDKFIKRTHYDFSCANKWPSQNTQQHHVHETFLRCSQTQALLKNYTWNRLRTLIVIK